MSLTYSKQGAKEGKPLNDLQRLASTENFALFQLRGMIGNLIHIRNCPTVPGDRISFILCYLKGIERAIKDEQSRRMQARSKK